MAVRAITSASLSSVFASPGNSDDAAALARLTTVVPMLRLWSTTASARP